MAFHKVALFLALNLLFLAAVHGCQPYCPVPNPMPPSVPVPPAVPVPAVPVPTVPVSPVVPSPSGYCPIDTLKLSVCANVLNLLKLNIAVPATEQCCPLLQGLVDLQAAVCLCTAIKASVLGINLNVLVDLTLLLNYCGKICPPSFACPV